MPETVHYDFTNMPNASKFIQSDIRFPCYFGGYANAKTTSLCIKALKHLSKYPGSVGALCRNTYAQLDRTTRAKFFDLLGCNAETASDHPDIEYWSKQSNLIRFKNGSELYFLYLEGETAIQNIQSMNLSFAGIDQAEQVSSAAFEEFDGRIRYGDCPHWVGTVGNPAGRNWIWKKFFRDFKDDPDYKMWISPTTDNPHLPSDYVPNLLKNHSQDWVNRFVYGSFDVFQGQIYDDFNETVHVIDPFTIPDEWKVGYGADFGFINNTAFMGLAIDYDGNWIWYDEVVDRQKLPKHYCDIMLDGRLKVFGGDGSALPVIGDPSFRNTSFKGERLEEEYYRFGLRIIPGNNDVFAGINRLKQQMIVDWEAPHPYNPEQMGASKFYVMRSCPNLIEELGQYQWKPLRPSMEDKENPPEVPLKVDDHCCDAVRYMAMYYASLLPNEPSNVSTVLEEEDRMYADLYNVDQDELQSQENQNWDEI